MPSANRYNLRPTNKLKSNPRISINTRKQRSVPKNSSSKLKPPPSGNQVGTASSSGLICDKCDFPLSELTKSEIELHLTSHDQHIINGQNLHFECFTDDEFLPTYEWAGQTRIRTTDLFLDGGLASAFGIHNRNNSVSSDFEVNIDGEDNMGNAQYTQDDVEKATKSFIVDSDICRKKLQKQSKNQYPSDTDKLNVDSIPQHISKKTRNFVSSLLEHIEAQQMELRSIPKCAVCMDAFTNPVTSTICWHVCCEICWLRALGMKKVCPVCCMITTPSDLRRVYF